MRIYQGGKEHGPGKKRQEACVAGVQDEAGGREERQANENVSRVPGECYGVS